MYRMGEGGGGKGSPVALPPLNRLSDNNTAIQILYS